MEKIAAQQLLIELRAVLLVCEAAQREHPSAKLEIVKLRLFEAILWASEIK